jgi:hypothetical protein
MEVRFGVPHSGVMNFNYDQRSRSPVRSIERNRCRRPRCRRRTDVPAHAGLGEGHRPHAANACRVPKAGWQLQRDAPGRVDPSCRILVWNWHRLRISKLLNRLRLTGRPQIGGKIGEEFAGARALRMQSACEDSHFTIGLPVTSIGTRSFSSEGYAPTRQYSGGES